MGYRSLNKNNYVKYNKASYVNPMLFTLPTVEGEKVSLEKVIAVISTLKEISGGIPYPLNNKEDRIKIVTEMFTSTNDVMLSYFRSKEIETDLLGLFHHVDNIRYMYEKKNLLPPQWFTDRYGYAFDK